MSWEEFEISKKNLFADPLVGMEFLKLQVSADLHSKAFQRQAKTRKEIQKFQKQVIQFSSLIGVPDIVSPFLPTLLGPQLVALQLTLEEALYQPSEPNDEDDVVSKKAGPREYPEWLQYWIFVTIDSAKRDALKLQILVKFFSPKGEFDRWIREKSKNVLRGPLKRTGDAIIGSQDEDFKWLNDLKRRFKSSLPLRQLE